MTGVTVEVAAAPLARRGRACLNVLLLARLAATAGVVGVELGGTPASSSQPVDRMPGLALAGDELFLATPTSAAANIDPESTTQRSHPGTFRLRGFDVTDGKVKDAQGLPTYYGGSNGVVVSDTNPPDVRAALNGAVLLTPGPGSGVVEAFRQ